MYRTVQADDEADATAPLVAFVDEMSRAQHLEGRDIRALTVDAAIEQFLSEYLGKEKGREEKTIHDYRNLHERWFSPTIGDRQVSRVDTATMDRLFGAMRQAGLSSSGQEPVWAILPFGETGRHHDEESDGGVPDADEPVVIQRADTAALVDRGGGRPRDRSPAGVGGSHRDAPGRAVGIRRPRIAWNEQRIMVDSAVSEFKRLKGTKTRRERSFHIDGETIEMLREHCDLMDERARSFGIDVCPDPFLFSLVPDCSAPIPPDYVTKRVGVLKSHLGIEDKRPDIVALEEEALRLRRQPARPRTAGMTGPAPKGGLSFQEIGDRLGRSERWAMLAVAAAERREQARAAALGQRTFDGSIIALRKFTSSELLDAGFNLGMIAQRQGHGPEVLARHYSKSRASADKRAADHLGRVVHGGRAH